MISIKHSFLICSLSFFISCNTKQSEQFAKPDNLIEKEKMVDLITELSILEATYQTTYEQISLYSNNLLHDADSLFMSFHTNKENYERSMEYYTHHRKEMTEIYQLVESNLKEKLEQLENKRNEKK